MLNHSITVWVSEKNTQHRNNVDWNEDTSARSQGAMNGRRRRWHAATKITRTSKLPYQLF